MRKQHVLAVLTLMFGALVLMCSTSSTTSTQPNRYWAEYSPTYANFQRHFDENLDNLDPIEGIWGWGRPGVAAEIIFDVAIVRSSIFEGFDYVGVAIGAVTPGTKRYTRGEIFIAFRNAPGNLTYGFKCASVLRGVGCASLHCDGEVIIADGVMQAESGVLVGGDCTPDNWLKRHPRR